MAQMVIGKSEREARPTNYFKSINGIQRKSYCMAYSVSCSLNKRAGVLDTNECIFDSNIPGLGTARLNVNVDDHSVDDCFVANLNARIFNVITDFHGDHLSSIRDDAD